MIFQYQFQIFVQRTLTIGLHVGVGDWLEFGRGSGIEELLQDRKVQAMACPTDELFQVDLGD